LIFAADHCRLSVVSYLEWTIITERQGGPGAAPEAAAYLAAIKVIEEPVTLQRGLLARQALIRCGRGRHPANPNFGDCFSYALAKALDEPLLFNGSDFTETDVRQARPL
jgi:ribonuclease VapC